MLKVGLTGGIGSGKSTIAKVFESLGIPVYYSDLEARKFLNNAAFVAQMKARWGPQVESNGVVDRAFIASIIFNQDSELEWMNQAIHPLVREDFKKWCEQQKAPYVVQEAAILFESGFQHLFDCIITVSASQEERLQRVIARDHVKLKDVKARMDKQWKESERIRNATYVIYNNDQDQALKHVLELHQQLLTKSQS
jgi:dephospho-CoA kinase